MRCLPLIPLLLFASPLLPRVMAAPGAPSAFPARVQAIRFWSFGDVTRIAIQTQGDYKLFSDQIEKPARVYFDLAGLRPPPGPHHGFETIEVNDRLLKQIRVAEVSPGRTRIVFDLVCPVQVVSSQLVNPDRLMIELRQKDEPKPTVSLARSTTREQKIDLPADTRAPITVLENKKQTESAAVQVASAAAKPLVPPEASNLAEPANLPDTPPGPSVATHETAPVLKVNGAITPAKRGSDGDRSLVRVLGLKLGRVVIDAGHGGHDTGTIGPNGLMEKDLVLDIALRLGKLITKQLGAEVIYTRSADVFIPLEQRTKIANNAKADLFISIHANSSPEPRASGVETFYFNLTSDRVGLDLATRENATALSSISDLNDLLHKAVLENKLEESREFAQKVQSALWSSSLKIDSQSRDRGVRQAPFVVLIGATMPSILAEVGFVSNPHDERLLKRSDERQKIAEGLLKGISQYASTLSHLQLARAGAE